MTEPLQRLPVTLADIELAAELMRGVIPRTPSVDAPHLSALTGAALSIKLEIFQHTGSFKDRGAYNKLRHLSAEESAAGVIAMSAGNHAQGVAHHAQRLGIPAVIVMPSFTPYIKVDRTRAYGAEVLLHGDSLSEASAYARALADEKGYTFVHPYDDPHIIAGQGTIGLEMLADTPDLDTLVVPIGGGGLISGIAVAAKALKPGIQIIGVQTQLYPAMKNAIAGLPDASGGATLAEGIAVKAPGVLNREIVHALVDDIVLVEETQIECAVELSVTKQKICVEGAGAAGLAAVLSDPERYRGRRVGLIACGGNIDQRILSSVLMRGLVRDGRLVRLRVVITDAPGTLARVSHLIGANGANIVEVYHQRLLHNVPVKMADLDVVVETRDRQHVAELVRALSGAGYPTELLTEV